MRFDLHCHSSASDGKLSPKEVLHLAGQANLDVFALTDHDTINGYLSVCEDNVPFTLVPGIELSCVWNGVSVHVVGLDFDPAHNAISAAVNRLRDARQERSEILDKKLKAKGMIGVFEKALQYCPDTGQIGRPHFAQAMVDLGYVATVNEAFDKWLGAGKMGDIKFLWPELPDVTRSIAEAGGVSVLAHPLRYKLTFTKLKRLMASFKDSGGHAVEVVGQQAEAGLKKRLVEEVAALGLAGSGGADFHDPEWKWAQIGDIEAIPDQLTPVWDLFKFTKVGNK